MAELDSLRHVVALKDSLLALAATRSVMFVAPNESVWTRLQPALIGAFVGGALAIGGGFGAQWYRMVLDTKQRRKQLYARMLYMLVDIIVIGRHCSQRDADASIPTGWIRDLLAQWTSYDRIADLALLKAGTPFSLNLHAFLEKVRMEAESVLELQTRIREDIIAGRLDDDGAKANYRRFNAAASKWDKEGIAMVKAMMTPAEFAKIADQVQARA